MAEARRADETLVAVRRALVAWFATAQRDLPWRRTQDPYATWVSEVMLQQTRVETVVPYFTRFMRKFPTVAALAQAPLDELLAGWAGLGYYARARHLHSAARELVARYDGRFPSRAEELETLPGIGRYTAGAIASIAFAEPAPIVDGNVVRVLARLEGRSGAANDPALVKEIWQSAERLVRADGGKEPGQLNQALMELGATVCTPTSPGCPRCPVVGACRAHALAATATIPAPKVKRAPAPVALVTLLLRRPGDGRALLFGRRPADGLFGGLWEPPTGARAADEPLDRAARRIAHHLTGLAITDLEAQATFEHTLTHRRLQITAVAAEATGRLRLAGYDRHLWRRPETVLGRPQFGIAAWTRRLLKGLP